MKALAAMFLGACLAAGGANLAQDKETTKIDVKDANGDQYKEDTRVKTKHGKYKEDSTVRVRDEDNNYKEKTKVRSKHGKTVVKERVKGHKDADTVIDVPVRTTTP